MDLGYNELVNIDLSKNINLIEATLSANKLSNIDISKNTNLVKFYASSNQLSSIDLSNNTSLKELYISSNNLDNLNAVFNNFDEFTNMKSLRVVDYYIVPVYGTLFNKSNLSKYKASNVNYRENVLYTDFNGEGSSFVHSSDTVNGSLGSTLKYRVCATNISGYHNYCGCEAELENVIRSEFDDNVSADGLGNYSGIVYYEGYREFKFINLTSDKYVIDEEKSIIDVAGDSDDVILANVSRKFKEANISIDGNKLKLSYNGELLKEFALKRVKPNSTGILEMLIVIGILISGVICIIIYSKRLRNEV